MAIKRLYQTKRNNKGKVNTDLILCDANEAWLGSGYYFWDTFIDNARWWGKVHYEDKYSVTEFICNFDPATCFDLHGEPEHILELRQMYELMKTEGLADSYTTVNRVLEYIGNVIPSFKSYKSIRACGRNTRNSMYSYIPFSNNEGMEFTPKIQICLREKNCYKIESLKVVYPE